MPTNSEKISFEDLMKEVNASGLSYDDYANLGVDDYVPLQDILKIIEIFKGRFEDDRSLVFIASLFSEERLENTPTVKEILEISSATGNDLVLLLSITSVLVRRVTTDSIKDGLPRL